MIDTQKSQRPYFDLGWSQIHLNDTDETTRETNKKGARWLVTPFIAQQLLSAVQDVNWTNNRNFGPCFLQHISFIIFNILDQKIRHGSGFDPWAWCPKMSLIARKLIFGYFSLVDTSSNCCARIYYQLCYTVITSDYQTFAYHAWTVQCRIV